MSPPVQFRQGYLEAVESALNGPQACGWEYVQCPADAGLFEFLEGVGMIRTRLRTALESEGLTEIKAVGRPFDPDMHEAVDKVQGTGPTDTVVEEIRKGYIFKGRVLRPSLVKVELAMKKNNEDEDGEPES